MNQDRCGGQHWVCCTETWLHSWLQPLWEWPDLSQGRGGWTLPERGTWYNRLHPHQHQREIGFFVGRHFTTKHFPGERRVVATISRLRRQKRNSMFVYLHSVLYTLNCTSSSVLCWNIFSPQPHIKLRAARQIYYQRLQPHLYIEGETRQLSYDVLAGDIRNKPFKLAKVGTHTEEMGAGLVLHILYIGDTFQWPWRLQQWHERGKLSGQPIWDISTANKWALHSCRKVRQFNFIQYTALLKCHFQKCWLCLHGHPWSSRFSTKWIPGIITSLNGIKVLFFMSLHVYFRFYNNLEFSLCKNRPELEMPN